MRFNQKIIFIFFILVFTLNFVNSGLETLGTFKKGQNIRVTQVCADANTTNITSISYPNSSLAISNVQMIKQGSEFYYNFNRTNETGRYDVRGVSDGCSKTFAFYFEVTDDGRTKEMTKSEIFFNVFLFILLFLAGIIIYVGYTYDEVFYIFGAIIFFSIGLLIFQNETLLLPLFFKYVLSVISYGIGFVLGAISINRILNIKF